MYGLIFLIIGSYLLAPFLFLIIIIISSFAFYVYKLKNSKQYSQKNHREFWNTPCTYLAKFWLKLGNIFHGYEIVGLDKIPKDGPAILILYHPPGAIDAFFIISTVFLKTKRKIIAIVDRMNFKIPGFQTYLSGLEQTAGTVESCVSLLKNGEILLIYPGGMKECLSSSSYSLQWKKYAGFGKVGQLAKVPVIPVFTKNTREIFGFLSIGMGFNFPFGWFPVKLKTYVGDAIEYDEKRSVEELVSIANCSLQDLIYKHKPLSRSIVSAIFERIN